MILFVCLFLSCCWMRCWAPLNIKLCFVVFGIMCYVHDGSRDHCGFIVWKETSLRNKVLKWNNHGRSNTSATCLTMSWFDLNVCLLFLPFLSKKKSDIFLIRICISLLTIDKDKSFAKHHSLFNGIILFDFVCFCFVCFLSLCWWALFLF